MEKHTAYFNLLEQLAISGCPICGQVHQSMEKFLDTYLYEGVTDRDNWNRLVASDGYCARHCSMMEIFSDGLAVSLFYGHLMKKRLAELGQKEKKPGFFKKEKSQPCPGCTYEEEIETSQCRLLAQAAQEPEFAEALKKNAALCLRHAQIACKQPQGTELIALVRSIIEPLVAELDEFVRKSDHRNTEKMGAEGDSWQRALRAYHGIHFPENKGR